MKITEKRIPQDGQFEIAVPEGTVDLRVSTLPLQWGESLVIRVLDKSIVNLNLDELGMPSDFLRKEKERSFVLAGYLL